MPKQLLFSASAASLKEEVTPKGEKGMPRGSRLFTRESSKIDTVAIAGKMVPSGLKMVPSARKIDRKFTEMLPKL